jgi:hypothetical protein
MRFEGVGKKLEAGIGFEPMYMGIVSTHVFDRFTTPPLVYFHQYTSKHLKVNMFQTKVLASVSICPVDYKWRKRYSKRNARR